MQMANSKFNALKHRHKVQSGAEIIKGEAIDKGSGSISLNLQ